MPEYTPLPAEIWLLEHWREVERRNFEWVAATRDGIAGHSRDLGDLMEQIDSRKLANEVVYVFVERPEPVEGSAL